jgi:O-antigen ligase
VQTVGQKSGFGVLSLPGLRSGLGTVWTIQACGLTLLTFLCFFPRFNHAVEYLFFLLFAVACAAAWMEGSETSIRTPIDLPLLLFAGWVLCSLPFATDVAYSFAEWRKLVVQIMLLYWVLLIVRHDRDGMATKGVLAAVAVGATILSIYAITEFFVSGGSWRDRQIRAIAPSSDYNWLTTYLIIGIPLLIVAAVRARDQWLRWLCAGALGIALTAQLFSYTRAGWLALVVEGIVFGLFTGRRKVAVGVLLVSLAIGGGFLAVSKLGYHQVTVSPETWEYRVALWEKGAREILSHPLVGVGYGNDSFSKRFGGHPTKGGPAGLHSFFFMVTLGSGIPALICVVWMFVAAVKTLVRKGRQVAHPAQSILVIGIAVMVTGFAVRNVFDYMFAGTLAYLFWILTATALGQPNGGRNRHEVRPGTAGA